MRNSKPELRQDPVSGEWTLLSTGRAKRPHQFAKQTKEKPPPKATCPFEDPQKSGNGVPLLWYVHPDKRKEGKDITLKDWFVQVIHNKYPAVLYHYNRCPVSVQDSVSVFMDGIGFHEVIISRPHTRSIAQMNETEVEVIIRAYQERFHELTAESCIKYVLVFHNHGREAGASIYHPHSQLIALPIIPQDINLSLKGSRRYYHANKRCVHCDIVKWEYKKKERIVYDNKSFVVVAPYVSRNAFELRIYPLRHSARFENIATGDRTLLADALIKALAGLRKGLNDIPYNFFIHTAPIGKGHYNHYHWHLEILPKTSIFAGVELGTGMEVVTIAPEKAALHLKKHIGKK